jgi:hypothetical protein
MSSKHRRMLLASCICAACYRGAGADDGDAASDDDDGSSSADGADETSTDGDAEPPPSAEIVGPGGLRRLTVHEYDESIARLLGDSTRPARAFLPEDPRLPFDNDRDVQVASSALVDGAETLAIDVAARFVADEDRRAAVVGCTPAAAVDDACALEFVSALGRRALRRPLSADEVESFTALMTYAEETGDAWLGIETIVGAVLQHPEFLYRIETGEPVDGEPGLFRLRPHEIAARLSYFLVGTTPDDRLLDLADAAVAEGRAIAGDELRAEAERLLADPLARGQLDRFHAMWLGYEMMPHAPELSDPMRAESRALIERVVFDEQRPWVDLLTSDETWVTAALAEHYGLPAPSDPAGAWIAYDDARAGLLSHGTFLANGGAFGDTSPVMRGLAVTRRLLCQVPLPPPPEVDADDEPGEEGMCKWDRWSAPREPACIGCHAQWDPFGWGLESYDAEGRYRVEDDAGCELAPYTTVDAPGLGTFSGPGELGALLADDEGMRTCMTTHVLRYALGRTELVSEDQTLLESLLVDRGPELALHELFLALVTSDAFRYRKEDSP